MCVQLDELRQLSEENGAAAEVARDELREAALRMESLSDQLAALQKEV